MESDMKSKPILKPIIISVILLTIGCCLIGVATIFPPGFMDFPCFIDYDIPASCIQADTETYALDINENARIHVFLNTFDVRFAGGGCNYKNSTTDTLAMTTKVMGLNFERKGDILVVNGRVLAKGDKFQYTNFWNPNPWTIYHLEFENKGLVSVCGSNAEQGVFIMWSYGSRFSPIKAGIVLAISIGLVIAYLFINNRLSKKT